MKAAQVGTTTFVEAHTRMNEIAMHAENVGRKGGTVSSHVLGDIFYFPANDPPPPPKPD